MKASGGEVASVWRLEQRISRDDFLPTVEIHLLRSFPLIFIS